MTSFQAYCGAVAEVKRAKRLLATLQHNLQALVQAGEVFEDPERTKTLLWIRDNVEGLHRSLATYSNAVYEIASDDVESRGWGGRKVRSISEMG